MCKNTNYREENFISTDIFCFFVKGMEDIVLRAQKEDVFVFSWFCFYCMEWLEDNAHKEEDSTLSRKERKGVITRQGAKNAKFNLQNPRCQLSTVNFFKNVRR